jgi:hypothetical protein
MNSLLRSLRLSAQHHGCLSVRVAVVAGMAGCALLSAEAWAAGVAEPGAVPWQDGCLPFIPAAEQFYNLPRGLLLAIAMTESGWHGTPYPWALNIAGEAVIAPSYGVAAGLLRLGNGQPRHDVAVGCMQIHMQYHLDRFVDPEWALHPRYNVWYAADFLSRLRSRYGTIPSAVAHYHASNPDAQRTYLLKVAANLAAVAPATAEALSLAGASRTVVRRSEPRFRRDAGKTTRRWHEQYRRHVQEARRIGHIIVLGSERP